MLIMVEKKKQQGHRDFSVYWVETRGRRKGKEEKEGEPAGVTCQARDYKWKGRKKKRERGYVPCEGKRNIGPLDRPTRRKKERNRKKERWDLGGS